MLAIAALGAHGLGPRRERQAAAHHEPEAHGADTLHRRPPSALRPDGPLGRPDRCLLCIPLSRARVAKRPLWDFSAARSSPSSALCPGNWPGSPQAGFREPIQEALGARRVPGATCCISAENCFLGCASRAGGASKSWCFLFALDSGELDSLARILPAKRIPPLQAGSLPRAAGVRLGCGAPAARPASPAPARSAVRGDSERSRSRQPGGRAGCVRKGPTSARSEQTRRKFVLPTLCPPGDAGGERGDGGGRTDPGWGRRKH